MSCFGDHQYLHSFPTRRSSDLQPDELNRGHIADDGNRASELVFETLGNSGENRDLQRKEVKGDSIHRGGRRQRSEEHTSELQSRVDLVCRLLLEKKKKT